MKAFPACVSKIEVFLSTHSTGKWSSPPTTGTRPPPCSDFSFTTINDHQAVLFGGVQRGYQRVNDFYLMNFESMVCPDWLLIWNTHAAIEYECMHTQRVWQSCLSDLHNEQHYYWTWHFHLQNHSRNQLCVGIVYCFCFPRSGPNWRNLRELLGQLRDQAMLPAASTMEMSTPSCWSLVDGISMATLKMTCGFWISSLGDGGRWVVMNVWLV